MTREPMSEEKLKKIERQLEGWPPRGFADELIAEIRELKSEPPKHDKLSKLLGSAPPMSLYQLGQENYRLRGMLKETRKALLALWQAHQVDGDMHIKINSVLTRSEAMLEDQ